MGALRSGISAIWAGALEASNAIAMATSANVSRTECRSGSGGTFVDWFTLIAAPVAELPGGMSGTEIRPWMGKVSHPAWQDPRADSTPGPSRVGPLRCRRTEIEEKRAIRTDTEWSYHNRPTLDSGHCLAVDGHGGPPMVVVRTRERR
jgi:hypothetical protein